MECVSSVDNLLQNTGSSLYVLVHIVRPLAATVDWAFFHCVDRVQVKLLKFSFDRGLD